ncbi:uncharacterized protein A1O9_11912, partial [Exophiala aquamarina CBS 119918]
MCQSHTIHNLCGHTKIKTIVQCAEMTERLLKGALENQRTLINGRVVDFADFNEKTKCTHQLFVDVSDTLHIFPDMCDQCKSSGVVGNWMEQDPGAKLQIFRSWRLKRRAAVHAAPHEVQSNANGTRDEACKDIEDNESETLQFIAPPNVSGESTIGSKSPSSQSSQARVQSVASSVTKDSTTPSLHDVKTRVDRLRARADHLIAKISVQSAAWSLQSST